MLDEPKKRERPAKRGQAMTAAERQQKRRVRQADMERRMASAEKRVEGAWAVQTKMQRCAVNMDLEIQVALKGRADFKKMRRLSNEFYKLATELWEALYVDRPRGWAAVEADKKRIAEIYR